MACSNAVPLPFECISTAARETAPRPGWQVINNAGSRMTLLRWGLSVLALRTAGRVENRCGYENRNRKFGKVYPHPASLWTPARTETPWRSAIMLV